MDAYFILFRKNGTPMWQRNLDLFPGGTAARRASLHHQQGEYIFSVVWFYVG
jgi:hypothetical protein